MLRRLAMSTMPVLAIACGGNASPPQAPLGAPPPVPANAPAPAPVSMPGGAASFGVMPLANPACRIAAAGDIGLMSISLRFHGKTFARLHQDRERPVEIAEARLGPGTTGGTVFVRSSHFDLLGELTLEDFWVGVQRPRLQDGFWIVRAFKAGSVTAPGQLAGLAQLPGELGWGERPVAFPCAELDLNTSRESPIKGSPSERWAFARPSRSDVRLAPGGPVVGTMNAPPPPGPNGPFSAASFTGYVLERRGGEVKLLIDGWRTSVIGWTDARVLAAKKPPPPPIQWGWGAGVLMRRCPFDVPVFVRDGGVETQVGVVRTGAPIEEMRLSAPGVDRDAESPLAGLGLFPSEHRADKELTAYVKKTTLEPCQTVTVSHPVRTGGGDPDEYMLPALSAGGP